MEEKLKEDIVEESNVESVEEEASSPETAVQEEAAQVTPPTEPKIKSPDEIQANNFKALRQKIAAVERERDELASKVNNQSTPRSSAPVEPDEDLEFNMAPDDLAEGKHLSKVTKKIKQLEAQIKSYQQNTVAITAETRLKSELPDIEKVLSPENIQTLRDMYPEIAATIDSNSDFYTKAKAAHTMIKKLGIHSEDTYIPEKQIALRNSAKPRPLASVSPQQGESPIARANMFAQGLTEELKAQLRKEMDESSKMM
jgi:hypothetical protein